MELVAAASSLHHQLVISDGGRRERGIRKKGRVARSRRLCRNGGGAQQLDCLISLFDSPGLSATPEHSAHQDGGRTENLLIFFTEQNVYIF